MEKNQGTIGMLRGKCFFIIGENPDLESYIKKNYLLRGFLRYFYNKFPYARFSINNLD